MIGGMKCGAIATALLLGMAPLALAQNAAGQPEHAGAMHAAAPGQYSRAGETQPSNNDTPTGLTQQMMRYGQRADAGKTDQSLGSRDAQGTQSANSPEGLTQRLEAYQARVRNAAANGNRHTATDLSGGQMNASHRPGDNAGK